jgi:hypothetical protein
VRESEVSCFFRFEFRFCSVGLDVSLVGLGAWGRNGPGTDFLSRKKFNASRVRGTAPRKRKGP